MLRIENLRLYFRTYAGVVKALDGVDLEIASGETLGLVGESGCGKSITAMSVMRLVPMPPGEIVDGHIYFKGRDLITLNETEIQGIRGKSISIIFQEPMTSLNPVMRVGEQIMEAVLRHQDLGMPARGIDRFFERYHVYTPRMRHRREAARKIAVDMLRSIGIADPDQMVERYPHELSGGMRQRVMIAMALACNPDLLIADEPTTALDVTIQAQIIELMKDLKRRMNSSILLITHHLGLVAEMCDRVAVMYAGHVVETAPTRDIFKAPAHPYTVGLLRSIPSVAKPSAGTEVSAPPSDATQLLPTISGSVPDLLRPPLGCRFHPRCPYAFARCAEERPRLIRIGEGHEVACFLWNTPGVELPAELAKGRTKKVEARA
ncbi:MAG: ABC transporter ATP-binding protein [Thermoplasmatota archaeon]